MILRYSLTSLLAKCFGGMEVLKLVTLTLFIE